MSHPSLRSRILLIDVFKALAAQLIMLHHFAWYGPLAENAARVGPRLDLGRLLLSRIEMRRVHYLGGTSYALFLVHFPVLLVVSAVFERYRPGDPLLSTLGLFVAWLAGMFVADQFHRRVELPCEHWRKRRLLCRSRLKNPASVQH